MEPRPADCPVTTALANIRIKATDLRPETTLRRIDEVKGRNDGKLPIKLYLYRVDDALKRKVMLLIVDAATGSGKSKEIPNRIHPRLKKKLLVINPSSIDIENIHRNISCAACYRMGANIEAGMPI
jgi:Tfp pilus assembly ATPase PilU